MATRDSLQIPRGAPSSSSLNLTLLSDPPARLMDGAAFDYFMIELVNTVRASAQVAVARQKAVEQEMVDAGLIPPLPPVPKRTVERESTGTLASTASRAAAAKAIPDEEEPVRKRLEAIGQHVGANITERLTRDRTLFADTLDCIKFVCKEIWATCWNKQVDNLRTNHRGVYVLQDNMFLPIVRVSSWDSREDATQRAKIYVALPAGIIRGALSRLGLQGTVTPEVQKLPQCTFQVKLR